MTEVAHEVVSKNPTEAAVLKRPSNLSEHVFGKKMSRKQFATRASKEGYTPVSILDADDTRLFPLYCLRDPETGVIYKVTKAEFRVVHHLSKD